MTVGDKLTQVFREVFEDDSIVLRPDLTSNDVEGWDSLSHINLILAIETKFEIKFSQKELLGFKNVGDLISCVQRKIPQ